MKDAILTAVIHDDEVTGELHFPAVFSPGNVLQVFGWETGETGLVLGSIWQSGHFGEESNISSLESCGM